MLHQRLVLSLAAGGLLVALGGGCASNQKKVSPSAEVTDNAASQPVAAPLVVAPPAEPAPAPQACSLDRIHFGFDSSLLDGPARGELQAAAACLQQKKPVDLVVEGHCDERGTEAYNLALGNRRASAVKAYLADLGVTAPMVAISFGKDLPLVKGDGEAAWSQNRRAELKLPGERRSDGSLVAAVQ